MSSREAWQGLRPGDFRQGNARYAVTEPLVFLAVDYVMERAVVTVPGLAAYASCDYRTARSALKALETVGAVEPHKESYPQAWIAVDLIDRVYGDD